MGVPGFAAGAFPTTGLGSLNGFIVLVGGCFDVSAQGLFDISDLHGPESSPASARAGGGQILVAGTSAATATAASGREHMGPSGRPGVGGGDGAGDGGGGAAAKPTLDCTFWDAARQPAGRVQAIDKILEGGATPLLFLVGVR
jgi:hypothetical protein